MIATDPAKGVFGFATEPIKGRKTTKGLAKGITGHIGMPGSPDTFNPLAMFPSLQATTTPPANDVAIVSTPQGGFQSEECN